MWAGNAPQIRCEVILSCEDEERALCKGQTDKDWLSEPESWLHGFQLRNTVKVKKRKNELYFVDTNINFSHSLTWPYYFNLINPVWDYSDLEQLWRLNFRFRVRIECDVNVWSPCPPAARWCRPGSCPRCELCRWAPGWSGGPRARQDRPQSQSPTLNREHVSAIVSFICYLSTLR